MPIPGKGAINGSSSSKQSSSSSHSHSSHHHHHHSHHHKKKASVQESLNASSLYTVYTMLNKMKTDLLWGRNQDMIEEAALDQLRSTPAPTTVVKVAVPVAETVATTAKSVASAEDAAKQDVKGHIRRPSTVSMASSNSSTGSSISDDSESEISNENDSGIESENHPPADKSEELAKQFRVHLNGLYRTLEQMTEAANYLTARYQSDVGQV